MFAIRDRTLAKSFTLSLVLHGSLVGVLLLLVSRPPLPSDAPLRVRILEEPSAVPQPFPESVAPPARQGVPSVRHPRSPQAVTPDVQTERLTPRPVPLPDTPREVAPPPPPPHVASRPIPEVTPPSPRVTPPPQAPREIPRDVPPPAPPERLGLSLGGPSQAAPSLPPATAGPTTRGPLRRSLRDQIASIGIGLDDEAGSAKRTVNLDSDDPEFLTYLGRLKRRIQNVWTYPLEAQKLGLGGELLLVFTLNKAGSLTSLRLTRSSGFPVLDEEALRAVRGAAPFDPFSQPMGDEPLNISASFHYDMPARFRRN